MKHLKNLFIFISSSFPLMFCPLLQAQTEAPEVEKKNSSTTIFYGVLDVGVTFANNENGHHRFKLDTGVMDPNRLGVRGVQPVSSQWKAIFQLESGFNVGDGSVEGELFSRVAMVGLSNQYGEFKIGTQYDLINDYVNPFNISASASGYASHQGDVDRMAGNSLQRAIKFSSTDFSGFRFGALYAFPSHHSSAEQVGSAWNIGMHYARGPFALGTSYMQLSHPASLEEMAFNMGLSSFLDQPTFFMDSKTGEMIPNENQVIDKQNIFTIGMAYDIQDWTIMANFSDIRFKRWNQTACLHSVEVGARTSLNPQMDAVFGLQRMYMTGKQSNQLTLGVDYHFSKRSDIYLSTDYRHGAAGTHAVIGDTFLASSNHSQTLLRVGMRHTF